MKKIKVKKNQYNFISPLSILIFLYNIIMLYHQFIPNVLILLGNLIFILYVYFSLSKRLSFQLKLLVLLIILIPTSFISIIGTSYASLPLSWFTIIIFTLFYYVLRKDKINKNNLLFLIVFIIYILISFVGIKDIFDSLKQFLTIIMLYFSVLLIIDSFIINNRKSYLIINYYYILTVLAFSITIFIQKFYIEFTGIAIGHYSLVGDRRIYGGLMNDYSFASLFIATGAILVLALYFEDKLFRLHYLIIIELLFLLSILVVNSRTGLVALFIIFSIYMLSKLRKVNIKALIFLGSSLLFIPKVLHIVSKARGGQSFLDSSGRIDNYVNSFHFFANNPFNGVGLGLSNLKSITGLNVPHNFFVQYLLQIGFLGTLIILIPFLVILLNNSNNKSPVRWMLYTVMIGSMFIPDIISSRFLSVIIIMFTINKEPIEGAIHE